MIAGSVVGLNWKSELSSTTLPMNDYNLYVKFWKKGQINGHMIVNDENSFALRFYFSKLEFIQ